MSCGAFSGVTMGSNNVWLERCWVDPVVDQLTGNSLDDPSGDESIGHLTGLNTYH